MTRDHHFPALRLMECVSGPPLSLRNQRGLSIVGRREHEIQNLAPVTSAVPSRGGPATGVGSLPAVEGMLARDHPSPRHEYLMPLALC